MGTRPINHIAVIPDGNRRWAEKNKILSLKGHERGAERINELIEFAFGEGTSYLTIWLASISNLTKRTSREISFLTDLFIRQLEENFNTEKFFDKKIHFEVIGFWKDYLKNEKLTALINQTEERTKDFEGKRLTLLFGYDGKREMLEAIKGLNNSKEVNEKNLLKPLLTGGLPPIDLVIRTGGEPHWSAGFMMWHTAESQFYFTPKFWPDFDKQEFEKAISDFNKRERRFGE
ncbi:MAG: polyprenyl diphosphate synthase [Patescibacteria group bacterium]